MSKELIAEHDRLIMNLEETSPNEGSDALACRCADSLIAIRQQAARLVNLKIDHDTFLHGLRLANNRIVEIEAQNKALADALRDARQFLSDADLEDSFNPPTASWGREIIKAADEALAQYERTAK